MKVNKFLIVLCGLISSCGFSQKNEKNLKKGNEEFKDKNFVEAEANYRIEKSKSEKKTTAAYNLGNAIYRQNSYEEAKIPYSTVIESSDNKEEKHKAYHNLGNILMKEKNYQGAVEAYKNALRNNPYDEQTRYNYALAKEMLKKNPPPPDQNQDKNQDQKNQDQNQDNQNKQNQKGGDNQDQKDNNQDKDKNQDKGDQNQDKDKGDNKNDQNQKSDGDQDKKDQGNPSGMSKQRIENLLEAVENQEKGIQQKVQKSKELEQRKGQTKQAEKNW
jgi:tetratricopeptide (TPR) repeat protein